MNSISMAYNEDKSVRFNKYESIATDWSEQTQTAREYTYDVDGRMTSDRNKGITSVTYDP